MKHKFKFSLISSPRGCDLRNPSLPRFSICPPTQPWLDNKHTVFGRVTKGMEVVQRISNVKVNPKTDKPYEDVSIINITVK